MRGWATSLRGLLGGAIVHSHVVYYVDQTGGNDGNSGRSPADAWKTVGKVNGETFQQGDTILFKRGETWALAASLTVPQHGLTFGAYGSGADPILDGQDTVDCIDGNGKHGLSFRNIEVTQGLNFGFEFNGSHNVTLIDCSAHDCGNDNLIFIEAYNCLVRGGTFYDAYTRLADSRIISGIEIIDGSHDIIVDGAEIYGIDASAHAGHYGTGIAIHDHDGETFPYNITIQNCTIRNQGTRCFGMRLNHTTAATMTDRNVVIANNTIRDGAYGGIRIASNNTPFRIRGLTIRDNVVRLNTGVVQVSLGEVQEAYFYRNVVQDNDAGNCLLVRDGINIYVWNNTLYNMASAWGFAVTYSGATCTDNQFLNNIIGNETATIMHVNVAAGAGTNLEIDYNLYEYTPAGGNRWNWLGVGMTYANWLTNNNNDANSPARGDPLFVNPAAYDFTLQAGSPAINAGVDVGLPYQGSAPDCGYAERE